MYKLVYSNNGILLNNKKKQASDTCNSITDISQVKEADINEYILNDSTDVKFHYVKFMWTYGEIYYGLKDHYLRLGLDHRLVFRIKIIHVKQQYTNIDIINSDQ